MRKSIFWKIAGALLLMIVAFVTGASGSVLFAEGAVDLPDGGKTIDGAARDRQTYHQNPTDGDTHRSNIPSCESNEREKHGGEVLYCWHASY